MGVVWEYGVLKGGFLGSEKHSYKYRYMGGRWSGSFVWKRTTTSHSSMGVVSECGSLKRIFGGKKQIPNTGYSMGGRWRRDF